MKKLSPKQQKLESDEMKNLMGFLRKNMTKEVVGSGGESDGQEEANEESEEESEEDDMGTQKPMPAIAIKVIGRPGEQEIDKAIAQLKAMKEGGM